MKFACKCTTFFANYQIFSSICENFRLFLFVLRFEVLIDEGANEGIEGVVVFFLYVWCGRRARWGQRFCRVAFYNGLYRIADGELLLLLRVLENVLDGSFRVV
mgnify:CR=1 FL=1